jgi:phosphosulfolactate synthase (CoM biosynthesis protein A)
MNNEPVAWMWWHSVENKSPYSQMTGYSQRCFSDTKPDDKLVEIDEGTLIPLYTHPAKELDEQFKKGFEAGKEEGWKAHKFHHPAKTLTDEEIIKTMVQFDVYSADDQCLIEAGRAILKKASQK